jgi:hypothetical protein
MDYLVKIRSVQTPLNGQFSIGANTIAQPDKFCGRTANRGWIRFSPRFHELTIRFKCQNYPMLYQGEAIIQTALVRTFSENDEKINQFVMDLSSNCHQSNLRCQRLISKSGIKNSPIT